MVNKKILFFAVSFGVLFSASLFLVPAKAADTTPVNGYAWSDNIGWIEMAPSFGGVFIDNYSGAFSGYAWSDNIGWIDFAPTTKFPSAPSNGAKLNWTTGQVSGWAKAVAGGTGGWDGWISMSGASPAYSVNLNKTTGAFSGYAWGSDVVGWVDFSKVTLSTTGIIDNSALSVSLTANPSSGTAPLTSVLTATVIGTATGPITYKFDCKNDGTYEGVFNNIAETTKTYSCTYDTAGSYTAKVYVERGIYVNQAIAPLAFSTSGGEPVVSLDVSLNQIDYNTSSTLEWSVVNADTCAASGDWSGEKDHVTGSEPTGNLTSDKTYTLICIGPKGTASDSVTVQVNPAPMPTCTLSANPSSGTSPLDVTLTASVSGGSGSGYRYKFDYTNDGTDDTSYSVSNTSTHSYTADSVAKATVKDSNGTEATCTTPISIETIGSLSVSLTANPDSNPSPMTSELKAVVSGTAGGTINYIFWWNCNDSGTDWRVVSGICGDPNNSDIGAKYDNVSNISKTARHTYSSQGFYTAKVIVERGSAPSAQSQASINVGLPVPYFSLGASPDTLTPTVAEGQPVSVNTTIYVEPFNGFNDTVSFSAVGLLTGATYTILPLSSSQYSTGSNLKIDLPGTTSAGTYTVTITGNTDSGFSGATTNVTLYIDTISTSEIWEF